MPTIAIVDDHLLLVETLREGLRRKGIDAVMVDPTAGVQAARSTHCSGAFEPAGRAPTGIAKTQQHPTSPGEELLELVRATDPDLVLLDLDLGPAGPSTPLISPLAAAGIRVLMVTGVVDRLRIAETLEQGAFGYLPKAAGFDALIDAAEAALIADGPLEPGEHQAMLAELRNTRAKQARELAPFQRLTEREQETLRALGEGLNVREIADGWVVSEATVRSHVRSTLTKLGATSQLQAVAKAFRRGWFSVAADTADPISSARAAQRRSER